MKDETSLSEEQAKSQNGDAIEEKDEAGEEEKWFICPCWKCCPGLGILPPRAPEKWTFLGFLKLIGQWVCKYEILRWPLS